ncbi:uncharacterized protein CLAFUR5_10280 [Fulvia fulva]|uniref:Uncharacterized protein n=1 Tax=Passalora fulva TaxID=5499 RepID=A0A9Q8URI5_PASFU|nr:uncharacterized protein CLAFUR5_10280 [Fulvia fulva]UJO19778.1 hypothetical protein CLAFUR5_10280 [Fulvia fulva]
MPRHHAAVLRLLLYLQCWILAVYGTGDATGHAHDRLGLAYAEQCQAQLFAYRHASLSYYSVQPSSTSYFTSTIVAPSWAPGTTSIASLTTLCDGHPRVVGSTIRTEGPSTNLTNVYTNTNVYPQSTGYKPPPCSIGPNDCALLYSSWTRRYSQVSTQSGFAGLLNPPCTTSTPSMSYSTNSAGKECNNCQVAGSKARLLYWPITTVPGSGNLCNKTAITIPGTRTADGPNTFVTAGVTITSPTIGVSIASLSRVDGCGSTIATTIIPVNPEEISSVRGNRAMFTHMPFNFADLNWHCPDGEYVTDDGHHNCYQEVPAAAYFEGTSNWVGLDAMNVDWRTQKNLTIWNDYHPQLLPPETMMEAVHSIWGKGCNIHPDGIWDPPIALQEATSVVVPTNPYAVPTESQQTSTSTAAPATYTAEYATQTADSGTSTSHEATASTAYVHESAHPAPTGGSPAEHDQPAHSVSKPPSHGGGEHDQGNNGGTGHGASSSSPVVVIHSVTYTRQIQSNGAEVLTNAQTHFTVPKGTAGSPPVVIISQKTYTVSTAPGEGAGAGYYLIGDGTTYGSDGQQTSEPSVHTQSTSGTDEEDTTLASDRRSGPTSTSPSGNAATTQGSNQPSSSAALQGSAASGYGMPSFMLLTTLGVLVVLTLQTG